MCSLDSFIGFTVRLVTFQGYLKTPYSPLDVSFSIGISKFSAKRHWFLAKQKPLLRKFIKQHNGLHPVLRALGMVTGHLEASSKVLEVHDQCTNFDAMGWESQ